MLSFRSFLSESIVTKQLKHLEHAEDHPINAGAEGFEHAVNTLNEVHKALKGEPSQATITTKYDGAPSIIFGRHPKTGTFFVSSKSLFNKEPKINTSFEDIDRNHGDSPGLAAKLKEALTHLPKVAPMRGVFQGDLMYTRNDLQEKDGKYSFTPNLITYSTPANSKHGKKIAQAKLGLVVHTRYKGSDMNNLEAQFGVPLKTFGNHTDVHVIDPRAKINPALHGTDQQAAFEKAIKSAEMSHERHEYDHLEPHRENFKTYINSTVRTGEIPTVEGFKQHVAGKYEKKASKLKTQKAQAATMQEAEAALGNIDENSVKFRTTFRIHKSLQDAKNALLPALDANQEFEHTINGEPTTPEGHVAIIGGNMPTKLVNRGTGGFAQANLTTGRFQRQAGP